MSTLTQNIHPYVGKIEQLLQQSRQHNFAKKQESLGPAMEALKLAEDNGDDTYQIICTTWLATVYCESFSDYKMALHLCESALGKSENVADNDDLLIRVHITFGLCYHYLGDLELSFKHYTEAVRIYENHPQPQSTHRDALGNLYYNIAVLFKGPEYVERRKQYLDSALRIYEETGFKNGLGRCYNAYSSYYASINQPAVALEYQLRALDIAEETNDKYGASIYHNNIGSMYIDLKEYEQGLKYLNQGLQLKLLIGNKHSIAVSYLHLGIAHNEMGKFDDAVSYLLKAREIMTEIDSKVFLHDTLNQLSKAYAGIGDYELAYKTQSEFVLLKDELFNFDKSTAINSIRAEFEIEKKEKEAQLLRVKNEEISLHLRKLEISNDELRQFAHVASHDLKEPLRMIGSYIGLLEKKAADKLNEEERQFLSFAVEGAKRMDKLINGLLQLSKVSAQREPSHTDLNKVVNEVRLNLRSVILETRTQIITDNLPSVKADRIQMLQLFQNLISNGIKYNNSGNPQVIIGAQASGNTVTVSVSDNGIGIETKYHDKIFNLFQRLHSRAEYSGTGIGLAICKKIVTQLGGEIWVESNPSGGTIFKLTLPLV